MKTLFNTPDERHAFLIGLCELLPPWKPRHTTLSPLLQLTTEIEHHYYLFGRSLSFLLLLTISYLLILAFR